MSDVTARWIARGIGAGGLAATAAAYAYPGAVPLAAAIGLSTAAGGLIAASIVATARSTSYPLDVPASLGVRPSPTDGTILLGAGAAGEFRASAARLSGGLCVTGPDAPRRAVLAAISGQAAEAGIAHAVISCAPSDTMIDRVRADGAGNPWTLTVLDAEAEGADDTHCLGALGRLPSRSLMRVLLSANPALRRDGAHATSARTLLQAVVPALCALYDENLLPPIGTRVLSEHIDIRRLIDLANPEAYPNLSESIRSPIGSYLSALPGYQEEKKYKQAVVTLEHHAAAAGLLDECLAWAHGPGAPACLSGVADAFPADLTAPGFRTVIRAAYGPGDERALRLMVAVLGESLRLRPRQREGAMPFLVIVDGLDLFPDEVAKAILAMGRSGIALMRGVGDRISSAGVRACTGAALSLAIAGHGTATAVTATLEAEGRSFPLVPATRRSLRPPEPIRRRLPIDKPSRVDLESAVGAAHVLMHLIDPDSGQRVAEIARGLVSSIPARAAEGDPIALAALRLGEFPDEDMLTASCGALATVLNALQPADAFPPFRPAARIATVGRPLTPARAPGAGPALDDPNLSLDFDDVLDAPAPPTRAPHAPGAVVVPASVGRDAQMAETNWKAMAGKRVLLAMLPDHAAARDALRAEFPHLDEIVTRILTEASLGNHIRLQPILFHGAAGSGKSRFARRLADVLGLRPMTYNCGGTADSSFGGTSRQWTSGRASIPLQLVARTGIANPAILLDEVEKVGNGKQNGNLADLMLGLTERETAARSFDLYLEAEVDLSHVTWLATANAIDTLHPAFRERFRTVKVPLPGIEHADVLIASMVRSLNEERGIAPEWFFRPSQGEMEMMTELWGGGSLRRLRRVVEKVMERVDAMDRKLLH